MSEDYQTYPLTMVHPGYTPPKMVKDGIDTRTVSPERLAPVTVVNEDDQAYYEAQGYKPAGKIDPSAWVRAQANPPPPDYEPAEYPKWVNGRLVQDAAQEAIAVSVFVEAEKPTVRTVDEAELLRAKIAALEAELAQQSAKPKRGRPRKDVTHDDSAADHHR